MPLARYFLFVGGALLALLFIADACMPRVPVGDRANSIPVTIRIHSDLKWPERVVYDTSLPTIVPTRTASTENDVPEPTTTVTDVPTKAREAFAQLQPSDSIQSPPSYARKREVKLQHPRKPARKRAAPHEFLMARQPHLGWFGYSTW
jgi:hypothetical protein